MDVTRYKKSGVDIQAGDEFVGRIKKIAQGTFGEGVIGGIGNFSALFSIDKEGYDDPVLVSATDGVGTKLKIATLCEKYDTVGIDLVAMCVNDVITSGAKPLFFLDYFATGKLESWLAEEVVKGIAEGCKQAGCSLIGGETAEMPGVYPGGEFDIAGFCVGIVERRKIVDGSRIQPGDLVVGFPSAGLHSNGYSLVRKILFEEKGLKIGDKVDELRCSLGEELLRPTIIYSSVISEFESNIDVHGMVHITGGGWYGNIPRVLPEGCMAVVKKGSWNVPAIFGFIGNCGSIQEDELFSIFNMGIGFAAFVGEESRDRLSDFDVIEIGKVIEGEKGVRID